MNKPSLRSTRKLICIALGMPDTYPPPREIFSPPSIFAKRLQETQVTLHNDVYLLQSQSAFILITPAPSQPQGMADLTDA